MQGSLHLPERQLFLINNFYVLNKCTEIIENKCRKFLYIECGVKRVQFW